MLNKLKTDRDQARKDQNKEILNILNLVISDCERVIGSEGSVSDSETLKIIKRVRAANIETSSKMASTDPRIALLQKEVEILEKYIPVALTEDEIRLELKELTFPDNRGQAIKTAVQHFHGQEVDNKLVVKLVQEIIGE